MKLVLVAAWEPELTRFRALAAGLDGAASWISMEPVGIGVVDAAAGTAELVARSSPSLVVFVGTCGSMRPELGIGDVVTAEQVTLVDLSGGAMLHPKTHEVPTDARLREALVAAGARPVRVANTLGVTTTDELAARVAAHGDVKHLEAFGVVRACARAKVACGVVLGVANEVGARGRDQWKDNHVAASARAAEVAFAAIEALRPRP